MNAELQHAWTEVKGHPYVSAGALFVVGAVFIIVFRSRKSTPAAASGQAAGTSGASFAQSEAIQAQLAAQQSQQQSALAGVNAQVSAALHIAEIGAATTQLAIGTSGSVAMQSLTVAQLLGLAGIDATKSIDLATINARQTVDLASLNQGTTLALIGATTQQVHDAAQFNYLTNVINDQYLAINNQTSANSVVQQKLLELEALNIANHNTVATPIAIVNTPTPAPAANLPWDQNYVSYLDQLMSLQGQQSIGSG